MKFSIGPRVAALADRIPLLIQKYKSKIPELNEQMIRAVNGRDPTGDQAKYTEWILRNYYSQLNRGGHGYIPYSINEFLSSFDYLKSRNQLPEGVPPDINRIDARKAEELTRTLYDLKEQVKRSKEYKQQAGKTLKQMKPVYQQGTKQIYRIPQGANPENIRTLCELTKNQGWCVQDGGNYARRYLRSGDIYLFLNGGSPWGLWAEGNGEFRGRYNETPGVELQEAREAFIKAKTEKAFDTAIKKGISFPSRQEPEYKLVEFPRLTRDETLGLVKKYFPYANQRFRKTNKVRALKDKNGDFVAIQINGGQPRGSTYSNIDYDYAEKLMEEQSHPLFSRYSSRNMKFSIGPRVAASPTKPKPIESSAYPGDEHFDPTHARSILGDLAEEIRSWLAEKQKARPPGLQTVSEGENAIKVIADNPEVGLGLEVVVSLLKNEQPPMPQQTPEVDLGTPQYPPFSVGPNGGNEGVF